MAQLGTLGAGNHFIEVDVVDQIYDAEAAAAMGLQEGMLTLMIHCGSRGFGHQICTDYVQDLQSAVKRYGIQLPDRGTGLRSAGQPGRTELSGCHAISR